MNNFEQCPLSTGTDISATATEKPKRKAWNDGVAMGQKTKLTRRQTKKIYRYLKKKRKEPNGMRNLAMFALAVDTMLRVGDLMSLEKNRVVASTGKVRKRFTVKQGKSKRNVTCVLTWKTRRILKAFLEREKYSLDDYLFLGVGTKTHFSTRQFRRLVKKWVEVIKLPPEDYSTHSMRRSKSNVLFRKSGRNWDVVRIALGHFSILSSQTYVNSEEEKALTLAAKIRMF